MLSGSPSWLRVAVPDCCPKHPSEVESRPLRGSCSRLVSCDKLAPSEIFFSEAALLDFSGVLVAYCFLTFALCCSSAASCRGEGLGTVELVLGQDRSDRLAPSSRLCALLSRVLCGVISGIEIHGKSLLTGENGESSLGEVGDGVEDDCRSSLGRDLGLSCTICMPPIGIM